MAYRYKSAPFPHQRKAFAETANLTGYALFWEQGCVDAETEFLSPTGWVKINMWSGQEVAQWDPATGLAEFKHPNRYIAQDYEGPMFRIHGARVPEQIICPNHRIPIMDKRGNHLRGDVSPQELMNELSSSSNTVRRMPASWRMKSRQGTRVDLTDEEIRLQIAVMADGSFPKNAPLTKRVVVRLKKQRKIDRLLQLLGTRERYQRDSAGYQVFSFQAPLREKVWPSDWWYASDEQRKIILEEAFHWDGCAPSETRGWQFFSRHESDVDLLQYLACCEGIMASKSFSSGVFSLRTRGTRTNGYSIKKKNVEVVGPPADGKRYCFSVPSGYWIARRNGHVYPTGNCGKTKPLIDTASYLFLDGKIDAMLVVAPNGVHRNWVSDEIPKHMPDEVYAKSKFLIWTSDKSDTKKYKSAQKQMLAHEGLCVLVVAYQATRTHNFKNFMKRFFAAKRTLMILDESHCIKTPGSPKRGKTTVTLTAMGKHSVYRRIATGTPLEKPPDVYSQIRFVDPTFWERHGFSSFEAYKAHFCVEVERGFGARTFSKIVGYKNLDELGDLVRKVGWRLTKEEAGLNLPPRVFSKRYCELTTEQWRVYNELKTSFSTKLYTGEELAAPSTMTRMLRLQQVACGFVACEAEQPSQRVDLTRNPRMDLACDEILDGLSHQAIVFHRFREDLLEMVRRLGDRCVPYHGKISDDDRARNKLVFQQGDAQFFVASYAAATGLTLVGAKTCIYYSNSFELIKRLQSQDRLHRIGQTCSVDYIDLIAQDTIDEYIVDALRKKFDIVNQVTQDDIKPWL